MLDFVRLWEEGASDKECKEYHCERKHRSREGRYEIGLKVNGMAMAAVLKEGKG